MFDVLSVYNLHGSFSVRLSSQNKQNMTMIEKSFLDPPQLTAVMQRWEKEGKTIPKTHLFTHARSVLNSRLKVFHLHTLLEGFVMELIRCA